LIISLLLTGCFRTDELPASSVTNGERPNLTESTNEAWINEYSIYVELDPTSRKVWGTERVIFKNTASIPLNEIYFNVYMNAFAESAEVKPYFDSMKDDVFPRGKIDYGYMDISSVTSQIGGLDFTVYETVLKIEFHNPVEANESVELSIDFNAYVPLMNHRTGANKHAIWFGNFFPILAVYDEKDGWHTEPYYPAGEPFYSSFANYSATIITPEGYTVVASAVSGDISEVDGKRTTEVKVKMARDFAFAVSNEYALVTKKTSSDKYINLYTYSNIKNKNDILDVAANSMDYFTSLLGGYPGSTFNIAETEMFSASGVSYPFAAFIDTRCFNFDPPYTTIANVVGRQWFYGVVGVNNARDAWLDLGLVSFISQGIFYTDTQITDLTLNLYDTSQKQIKYAANTSFKDDLSGYTSRDEHSLINITKAKLMLYSLKQKLGNEKFNELIKTYFNRYSYKIASSEDFIRVAEEIYGDSLNDFFKRWMNGNTLPELFED